MDDGGTYSEGGNADDEYNNKGLPTSAREGVYSSKSRKQQAGHVPHPAIGHVNHLESHPHADDTQRLTVDNPQEDLLIWNYCLGRLSFKMIKTMATVGLLSMRIATEPISKCSGCMFSAMAKNPWAASGHVGRKTKITRPGQCVSVDQLKSPQVGFIVQLKGIPTKKHYRYAMIFVDHCSDLNYVHYMEDRI